MLMPGPQDHLSAVEIDTDNTRKFGGIKAITVGNRNLGFQPYFGVFAASSNMHMTRLAWQPFVSIEEIAKTAFTKDDGHFPSRVTRLIQPPPNC
jgi:hypothetical protein